MQIAIKTLQGKKLFVEVEENYTVSRCFQCRILDGDLYNWSLFSFRLQDAKELSLKVFIIWRRIFLLIIG